MIKLGEVNENKVLTINIQGKLTKQDYEMIMPQMIGLLNRYGSLRFYIELEDFHGFELGALWEDIKFDTQHQSQYGRTAIVGEHKWEEWGTKISNLFFSAEMKFFYTNKAKEAWAWVNQ